MEIKLNLFGVKFPPSFFTMVLLFIGLGIFFVWLNHSIKKMNALEAKTRKQMFIETIFESFDNLVNSMVPKEVAKDLTPLIMLLFLSIFIGNMTALIAFKEVAYQSVFPIVWGLVMFVVWNGYAIYKIGVKGYLKTFIHPSPIFLPIEIISALSKLLSITMRLLGNITSGVVIMLLLWEIPSGLEAMTHNFIAPALSGIILVPITIVTSFYFALFAPFLQALVFSMISLGNIAGLIEEEE